MMLRNKDEISGEVVIALGEVAQAPYRRIQGCYESGKQPEYFKKCSLVSIPKRVWTEKCEEH